ncbi:tyrosine-type recombinase/integrase [Rheinheimera faecalis]
MDLVLQKRCLRSGSCSKLCITWFKELEIRAAGSPYVFPNRRSSKNPYMGQDTLNRAITKLFGHEAGKKIQPSNKMGDIQYFSVHDLRRTCRTMLAQIGVPGHIAERCLNHKLKGVEGIYNKHDYFEERNEALRLLSLKTKTLI